MGPVFYYCLTCEQGCLVTGNPDAFAQLDRILAVLPRKCITDGCTGAMEAISSGGTPTLSMTVQEFVAAVAGLGLPKELDASEEKVAAILGGMSTVTRFTLKRSSHPHRTIIESLELGNEVTLHLAAGPEGATIYRISRRPNGSDSP